MCAHCGHIEKFAKENSNEKLMEHQMDCCDENPINCLDDTEYFKKLRVKLIIMSIHMLYVITLISMGSCNLLCL